MCEVEAARRKLPLLPQKLSFTVRLVIREPYREAGQKKEKKIQIILLVSGSSSFSHCGPDCRGHGGDRGMDRE